MVILLAAGIANAQDKTIKRVPAKPTTSISGKSLFHEYCAVCHGDDGKGAGPAASALKQPPGDLTSFARNNSGKFPEERFLGLINGSEAVTAHGTQDMPIWGTIFSNSGNLSLTQLRVHALLEFVEQMQAK
jgi:mono/diheme cytochrome c family protein